MALVVESTVTISATQNHEVVCLERPKLASHDRLDHLMILAFERLLQFLSLGDTRLPTLPPVGIRR